MSLALQAFVALEPALFEVRLELAQLHLEDCEGAGRVSVSRHESRHELQPRAPALRTREIQWPVLVHVSQLRPNDFTMPSSPSLERPCKLVARFCPSSLPLGSGGPIEGTASLLASSICHFTSRLPNCAETGAQRRSAASRVQAAIVGTSLPGPRAASRGVASRGSSGGALPADE